MEGLLANDDVESTSNLRRKTLGLRNLRRIYVESTSNLRRIYVESTSNLRRIYVETCFLATEKPWGVFWEAEKAPAGMGARTP